MKTAKELKEDLKLSTRDLKDILMQKRAASFKKLSNYSKKLIEEQHQKAVGRQMDIIMQIVDLNLPEGEAEKLVNTATK